jgi:multidrug efflux system outer membrane protein
MMKRVLIALVAAGTTACMVGPSYRAPEPETQHAAIALPRTPDSTRAFFDSLAAARRRDSVAVAGTPVAQRLVLQDSMAGVAWLDILRDTTLVRLVNTALKQNRNLLTAVARIQEYRAQAGVARAPLMPSVTANGSVGSAQIALGIFPPASYHATRVTGDVSWELDFWGRIRHGLDAANADVAAQVAAERGTVLSLVSDVATGYLQLLELDQEHDIAQQTLASRKATLAIARDRYEQGQISELDVKQFEAQVAAPAVTLAQTERERAQAEHALNVLLGEGTADIPRGSSLADAVRALVVPDSVPASLLSRRPDLEQAERQYAAATARLGMADAARMPPVMVTGSYGSQASKPDNLFNSNTRVYSLQLGVSIPIFDGGRLADQAAVARARVDQARLQYQQSALSALRDANDALVAVHSARDEEAAQATQVEALREALNLAQLRYQAGLASYLDLLDAQRSLFAAQLALSRSQLQQLTAAVELYKALGGGWPGAHPM